MTSPSTSPISVALVLAADHPAFAGHFPSRPIVPGVVLLDLGLRAMQGTRPSDTTSQSPLRIASAKFLSMVGPGEPVRLEYVATSPDACRLSIYAGVAADERLAVTGVVRFGAD